MKIKNVHAYEILASGGYPTIECEVTLVDGLVGTASVPYGASAGSHEATVLTDGDKSRWQGKGMLKAISNIETIIAPKILGLEVTAQQQIDQIMLDLDGTENKSVLGGNAILAVSLAVARAAAASKKVPLYKHIIETYHLNTDLKQLPKPMVVVIEGGKHAENSTDLQEYCFTSIGDKSAREHLRTVIECYHELESVLQANKLSTNVGNEGAFAPSGIVSNEAPFDYMLQAIKNAGYDPGKDIGISIDAAASEFYDNGIYNLKIDDRTMTSAELIAYFESWFKKYPLVTIEDPLAEDDWDNWVTIKSLCDKYNLPLIGDDLTVTNPKRLQKAIELGAISSILIKLNQIGTLTETVKCCLLATSHNLMTTTSHRGGGETNDSFMIDLAVAVGSRYIKVGPSRGERVAKHNRLLQIERELHAHI